MSVKHQVYSKHKDSGFIGLGMVPVNWKLSKFKYEVFFQEGPGILAKDFFDEGVPLIRIQNVKGDMVTADFKTYLAPETVRQKWDHFRVEIGDLLISGSASTDLVSEVTEETEGAIPYTGIIRLKPLKGRSYKNYLRYFVTSELFSNQIGLLKTGSTIQHFGPEHLRQVFMLSPSLSEQQKIANFLDHETAKIDTLIDKQQQLIKLLKEKRQAVISHAVTKGLNPDAPMKDSGVEWLGEVPEHWEVVRMRYLCNITTGGRDTQDAKEDGAYPFFVRSDTIERIDSYSFDGEGVMTSGDGAGVGKIFHHFVGKCEIHQRVYLFHQFRKIKGRLLYLFIKENLGRIVLAQSAKSTVDSLRLPMLQDFPICFGPEKEQGQICEHIEVFSHKIEHLLEKAESSILLLKERRTALISAAVTGKIDVRNW